MLAATAVAGDNAVFALQVALVHLVYNTISVITIYGIPFLREIPLWSANKLATAAVTNKLYAAGYIMAIFFVLPLVLIGGSQILGF